MKMDARILIVDDEQKVLDALRRIFDKNKYEVLTTTAPREVLDILTQNTVDIIICDYNMPNMSGIDVLKLAKKIMPDAIRILITGYSDINIAVSAINEGSIYYYFSKPWKNQEVIEVVEKALENKREQEKKASLYEIINDSRDHIVEVSNRLKSFEQIMEPPFYAKKHSSKAKSIKKYPVRDDENIILINPSEIIYLTTMNGDVFVITEIGEYKSTDSLNSWENNLDEYHFFRRHRSYIVNIERVEKIIPWFNSAYNIKLKDRKEDIPVSRGAMKKLKELLGF